MFTTPNPHDLVIGLDRSDKKADLCLIDTHTGRRTQQPLETSPESLHQWQAQLRREYPNARVA